MTLRENRLAEIIPYNHNTSRFVFDLPEGTHSGLTVASALVVKSATEGEALGKNGKPAIRFVLLLVLFLFLDSSRFATDADTDFDLDIGGNDGIDLTHLPPLLTWKVNLSYS